MYQNFMAENNGENIQEDIQSVFISEFAVPKHWAKMKKVYETNWKIALGIALTFTFQYCFYPGVMLKYQFTFLKDYDFAWFVIAIVTYHALGDLIGRTLGGIPKL